MGERVRHVNKHVRIFCDWKQIYVVFGISSLKVTLNTALPSKPCSLCDPGDPRPIVSQHTRQTRKHHSPLLHDKTNFRFQWRHTDIRHPWLNGSYKALEVFPFEKKERQKTLSEALKWSTQTRLQPQAQLQSKMPWHGIKKQPQWHNFSVDTDHSLTWDGVWGNICQTPLITNIPQRHKWSCTHT